MGWAGGAVKKIATDLENCGFEVFDMRELIYVPEKEEMDDLYELGKKLAVKIKEM